MIRLLRLAPLIGLLAALLVPGYLARSRDRAEAIGSGPDGLVRLESNPTVFNVLYRYGQNTPAPNGAYGPNVHAPRTSWYLESQRAGALDINAGALRPDRDPSLIALGLKMLHFGLARQARSGLFPGSAWPFHGTAMFLSESAPALVTLKTSPLTASFSGEIRWQTVRMRRAAYAMVKAVGGPGHIDDRVKNHRYFEAALALGAVGVLASDQKLVRWSHLYAWHGIGMQRADGVMPENGGHDSGYQALGMVTASRYLVLVARGSLRSKLTAALKRGEGWELSRVEPDGSINQSGDTRTAGCQERDPAGQCKTAFFAPIFSALAHWAALSNNATFAKAAHAVWVKSGYGGH